MEFSLSTSPAADADRELARVQQETALAAYEEKGGERKWEARVTTDVFFQETPELRRLLHSDRGGRVSAWEMLAAGLVVVATVMLAWLPDWSFLGRGPVVEMPRAEVPPLPVAQMPMSMRQRAEGFNEKCVQRQWTEAWKELTILCKDPAKGADIQSRKSLRECLYLLAMNRVVGDLDESSWESVWKELKEAEEAVLAAHADVPDLSDEAYVAFLRVAHLRDVKPVLNRGLDDSKPPPQMLRKDLNDLGNQVRELQQRRDELDKDSQQRLDVVDAAVHLALVWTMTTKDVNAKVTVQRKPEPPDDPEMGRWWDRVDGLMTKIDGDPAINGRDEWRLLRKGFWQTLKDFTWIPLYNENIRLGSRNYEEKDVDKKLEHL